MSKEANIINNLFCFNINFSKHSGMTDLTHQSPDYILEKFNKWIVGEEPRKYWEMISKFRTFEMKQVDLDEVVRELDDASIFGYMEYQRVWGKFNFEKVRPILIYLLLTKNLNLYNMVNQFERIIGSISSINPIETNGLHVLIMRDMLPKVVELNSSAIKNISRDLKINSVI